MPRIRTPRVMAVLLVCGALAASVSRSTAQAPLPPVPVAAAAAPPTTLWTFLGFNQMGACLGKTAGHIAQKPLVKTVCNSVVNPMLQTLGLLPPEAAAAAAGAGAGPGGPPPAVALAGQIAAENSPANVQLKVKAIRYLASVDCICYPEVIDALLASLDDCAEPVRYEALRALQKGCTAGGCAACYDPVSGVNSPPCSCQTRVIVRLSDLLLIRDANAQLLERSHRVRQLAQQMLESCLRRRPIQQPGLPDPVQPRPDPVFDDLHLAPNGPPGAESLAPPGAVPPGSFPPADYPPGVLAPPPVPAP